MTREQLQIALMATEARRLGILRDMETGSIDDLSLLSVNLREVNNEIGNLQDELEE